MAAGMMQVGMMQAGTFVGMSGDLVYSLNTETGVLSFSGDGAMADYEEQADQPWFSYRNSITTVTFWGNPTRIGNRAFQDCNQITSCEFPASLTSIGEMAFEGCLSLEDSVSFSPGLTSIEEKAFSLCKRITDFTLPATLTSIGVNAFLGCRGVTDFRVSEDNPNYCSLDGVLYNKAQTTIINYPVGSSRTSYTMPETVTTIGDYAIELAKNLTSITLSPNLQVIGRLAFSDCSVLTEITIPASVTTISAGGFAGCVGLTKIICYATLPPECGAEAFAGVEKSIPLYVPEEVIDDYRTASEWKEFSNILPISTEGVENVQRDDVQSTKVLRDGVLLIERNDKTYNAQGAEVR